jgi:hypothetical protein
LAKFRTKKITLKQIDDYQQNNLAKFGYKAYVKVFFFKNPIIFWPLVVEFQ